MHTGASPATPRGRALQPVREVGGKLIGRECIAQHVEVKRRAKSHLSSKRSFESAG